MAHLRAGEQVWVRGHRAHGQVERSCIPEIVRCIRMCVCGERERQSFWNTYRTCMHIYISICRCRERERVKISTAASAVENPRPEHQQQESARVSQGVQGRQASKNHQSSHRPGCRSPRVSAHLCASGKKNIER